MKHNIIFLNRRFVIVLRIEEIINLINLRKGSDYIDKRKRIGCIVGILETESDHIACGPSDFRVGLRKEIRTTREK